MPFLSPNQKCQDIEGHGVLNLMKVEDKSTSTLRVVKKLLKIFYGLLFGMPSSKCKT